MMNNSPSDKVAAAAVELVFIPVPFSGHIASTVELAKRLVDRDHRLSITIFILKLPFDPMASAFADSLPYSVTQPRIRFVPIPPPSSSSSEDEPPASAISSPFIDTAVKLISKNKQGVKGAVTKLVAEPESDPSHSGRLVGFVIDMFCWPMTDVANEFGIPCYVYYTSGAAYLGLAFHLQALHDERGLDLTKFKDSDIELAVPSFVKPVPLGEMLPSTITDKRVSIHYLNRMRSFRGTKGILVNTFAELESHAIDSFSKGIPAGIPPVYPVGPLPNQAAQFSDGSGDPTDEIVKWLDEQPPLSVVFLCFGSMGRFEVEQVREIAYGLECSGHRFLWSLRLPPPKGKIQPWRVYSVLEEVLPKGFLKRTVGIGKVIGWAPQVVVLSHAAIGGFVSHCGWNSVLESLWFGVPIATWPMYGEQQANAFTIARELGLAAEVTMNYRMDLKKGTANFVVGREEVERGIRCVMVQDSKVREKVRAMGKESKKAAMEGGSSYTWLGRFIEDVINFIPS